LTLDDQPLALLAHHRLVVRQLELAWNPHRLIGTFAKQL
jgi:hypothetical protein